jgi:hypothetical protein
MAQRFRQRLDANGYACAIPIRVGGQLNRQRTPLLTQTFLFATIAF